MKKFILTAFVVLAFYGAGVGLLKLINDVNTRNAKAYIASNCELVSNQYAKYYECNQ